MTTLVHPMEPEPETKVLPRGSPDVASSSHGESSAPLRTIGRYEIVQRLGHGGMATVYLGRATGSAGFERLVAVKVIHPHLAAEHEFVEMFLDEARIAAKIHSPHIASILDLGEDEGTLYMVMEFIDGETLSALLRQLRPADERLPLSVALQVLADACEGLAAVHDLRDPDGRLYGLVHRDMSPQNLIINFDGWTKIVDFGLVKATGLRNNSHTGHLRGKLAYMSPEQARGRSLSARTDLFALGVIFWEMLTGRRLFAGETDAETLDNVMRGAVQPLRELRPDLPPGVEALLRRALAPDPDDRYPSAEAMLADIRALLRECADTSEPRRALAAVMRHHFAEQAKYRMAAVRGAARQDGRPRMRLVQAPGSGPLGAAPPPDDTTRRDAAGAELESSTRVLPSAASRQAARAAALEEPSSPSRNLALGPGRQWGLWLALPMLGAGLAVVILLTVFRWDRGAVAPPEPTPADARAAVDEPPRPKTVVLHFVTEPGGARVELHGAAPAVTAQLAPQLEGRTTPLRLVVPYDEVHELSLEFHKPGYKPGKRSLIPMNNENHTVELQPLQAEVAPTSELPQSPALHPGKRRPPRTAPPERQTPAEPPVDARGELKDEPKFDLKPAPPAGGG